MLITSYGARAVNDGKKVAWLKSSVKMQWVICIGLCPVLLVGGMGVSVTSMFANFVAIPLVGLVTVPLILLALVIAMIYPPASSWLLGIADLSLVGFIQYLSLFSDYSSITFSVDSLSLSISISVLVLFIIVFPIWGVARFWAVSVIVLLIAFRSIPGSKKDTEFVVLDVGQGLSVVAVNGRQALIYDTGPSYRRGSAASRSLIPYLKAKGVTDIALLVISHGDDDHAGGLVELESEFNVDRLVSGEPHRLKRGDDEQGRSSAVEVCSSQLVSSSEWYSVQFFSIVKVSKGSRLRGGSKNLSANNHSCVIRVQLDGYSVLLMGDLEKKAESLLVKIYGRELDSDILVAGHHGSKNATSRRLLNVVSPDVVIFSAGYKNRFNHPHPNTVSRVNDAGIGHLNTATDGAVVITKNVDVTKKDVDVTKKGVETIFSIKAMRHQIKDFWMY